MRLSLKDAEGNTLEIIVPTEDTTSVANAGEVVFRGISYRYSGIAGGKVLFEQAGPTVELREEWVR